MNQVTERNIERLIVATAQLKELAEHEMTPINLAKISLLNRELAMVLVE